MLTLFISVLSSSTLFLCRLDNVCPEEGVLRAMSAFCTERTAEYNAACGLVKVPDIGNVRANRKCERTLAGDVGVTY
jgi:hypothetical protein